jgi:hypothetical protein
MALFTDGPISCIEDLTAQDSQLLSVASVEGIDTAQKIAIAQEQMAMDLSTALNRASRGEIWMAPRAQLSMVVVTPPLKLWHTARALELIYMDAYNSQLNDRYAGKRNQFHELAGWAYSKLAEIGVGIAAMPVAKANVPFISTMPGALSDGVYYASIAWMNRAGEEGEASTLATVSTTSSTFLIQAGTPPANAAGWNVYAGISSDAMYRQNNSQLQAGQTWQQPSPLVQRGTLPGKGQKPTYLHALPRIVQRG